MVSRSDNESKHFKAKAEVPHCVKNRHCCFLVDEMAAAKMPIISRCEVESYAVTPCVCEALSFDLKLRPSRLKLRLWLTFRGGPQSESLIFITDNILLCNCV